METKTHNSYFKTKKLLRETAAASFPSRPFVADFYAGRNTLWRDIPARRVGVDIKNTSNLRGNNLKYVGIMKNADIIDLDAFGFPLALLDIVAEQKDYLKGKIVIFTIISSEFGDFPKKLYLNFGYNKNMIKKCRTILAKNLYKKICKYLTSKELCDTLYLVKKNNGRKLYGCFRIGGGKICTFTNHGERQENMERPR